MKIHKINPNCSEIVVRLGRITQASPIEDVRAEIKEVLNCTEALLALETQYWEGDRRKSYFLEVVPDQLIYTHPEPGNKQYVELGFEGLPHRALRGTLVKELEQNGWESIVLTLPTLKDSATITYSGFGPEMVLMISDYEKDAYPVIAQVIRAMGYVWSPHDGGHGDGFIKWCNSNGYQDVARMTW